MRQRVGTPARGTYPCSEITSDSFWQCDDSYRAAKVIMSLMLPCWTNKQMQLLRYRLNNESLTSSRGTSLSWLVALPSDQSRTMSFENCQSFWACIKQFAIESRLETEIKESNLLHFIRRVPLPLVSEIVISASTQKALNGLNPVAVVNHKW